MLLALLTLSLLADIAPGPPLKQPPRSSECTADTDCVVSTYQGCCGSCCVGLPHGVRRGVDEARACGEVDCASQNCAAVRCAAPPDLAQFVPACRGGRCVAVPLPEAPAQCRVNEDCTVVTMVPPAGAYCHRSPCGCCPVTQAIPIDGVPLPKRAPERNTPNKPKTKPNFGLSTGGPPPPQAPNCSPCPAPSGGTALCQSGRCVLLDRPPRPIPPG